MKHHQTALAILVAAVAHLASCQSLSSIPLCGREAALAAIQQSGCPISDLTCICSKISVLDALRSNIIAECSPEDQELALKFQQEVCGWTDESREGEDPAAEATAMVEDTMAPMSADSTTEATAVAEDTMASMSADATADPAASSTEAMDDSADGASNETSTGTTCIPVTSTKMTMASDASDPSSPASMEESMPTTAMTDAPQFTGGAAANRPWVFLPAFAIAATVMAVIS